MKWKAFEMLNSLFLTNVQDAELMCRSLVPFNVFGVKAMIVLNCYVTVDIGMKIRYGEHLF